MNFPTRIKSRNEEGSALLIVMLLSLVMVMIATAFFSIAGSEAKLSQGQLDSQRAFWLAEAGIERALLWLSDQPTPPNHDTLLFDRVPGPDTGNYTVTVLVDSLAMWAVEKGFMIESIGRSGNLDRRIRQRVNMISFAQYAYFTDRETTPSGGSIWYTSSDDIYGLFHTNGTIRIRGDTRFHGKVTSASDHMTGWWGSNVYEASGWPVGGNDPYFADGFELNVPEIPLPAHTMDIRAEAFTNGLLLPHESEVQLGRIGSGNGTDAPGWLRYRDTADTNWVAVDLSTLGTRIIYCDDDLHLQGVLDGELTIASRNDVYITDDILYHGSDATGKPLAGCNDLLGIIAEDNIIYAYELDGMGNLLTQDLIVDGVMMAMNTSITAQDYSQHPPRGVLTIWGGLIQRYRGPVGTFNSTGAIGTGYAKNYNYDPRVTTRTPPGFPMTGVYERKEWEETWDASDPFS